MDNHSIPLNFVSKSRYFYDHIFHYSYCDFGLFEVTLWRRPALMVSSGTGTLRLPLHRNIC